MKIIFKVCECLTFIDCTSRGLVIYVLLSEPLRCLLLALSTEWAFCASGLGNSLSALIKESLALISGS